MNISLRPTTLAAIASFRKRRRVLLWQRAGMAALLAVLLLLLVVALVDRLTFMPDALRTWLSYGAYAVALLAGWWMGLRLVHGDRELMQAARLMEDVDTRMHEKLLAAVELSKGDPQHLPDSPEFRALLQEDVAKQLETFDAKRALPAKLNRKWVWSLGSVVLVIAGLCLVGELHLPGFMARAALPFANIGRPSSTKVRIVAPAGGDALVALASSVPLAVQIDGRMPKRILVETRSNGGKPSRMELSHAGANRYDGSVGIGQHDVTYRILAGDAVTPWHTLEARPRPRIVEFVKKVTPPSYTGLPEEILAEDHGDIAALEGSKVTVTMKANQPIESVEARLLPGLTSMTVRHDAKDVLLATVELDGKSDAWQLVLKAQETKFTNEEATPWRLETIPDLPPSVVITQPHEQIQVRSDEDVAIMGQATDDVGLKQAHLSYAINGASWIPSDLTIAAGKESPLSTTLRLAPLPVKTGDSVLVRLGATDLKGQRVESTPIRLFIVEDKLDPVQRQFAAQQRVLAQQATALAAEVRRMRQDVDKVRGNQKKGEDAESEAAIARLKQDLAAAQEKARELWEQLTQHARQAPNARKAMETNLVAQRLAELQGQHLREVQDQLQSAQPNDRQLKESVHRAADAADTTLRALQAFAAVDTALAARESLEHLAPQQVRLAERAMEANRKPDERAKWQEQQRAALAAAMSARQDLEALKEVVQPNRVREVTQLMANLDQKVAALTASLDKENQPQQQPDYLNGHAQALRQATEQARDATRAMADETSRQAQEMRDRMMQQQNPALATLERAQDHVARALGEMKKGKPARPEEEPQLEQAVEKLTAAARQFKDQSEMREQNHQTNSQAALDMNRMGRALEALSERVRSATTPAQVQAAMDEARKLVESARALQADALAEDASQSLQQAQEAAMAQADTAQPLPSAQAAASQLKMLPDLLRRMQQPDAANASQEAAVNAQWQREEMENQLRQAAHLKQNGQQPPPLSPQQNPAMEANARATAKLEEVRGQLAPKVAEARQALEAMTPKLSELAENTAQRLQRSQQQTQKAVEAAQGSSQTPQQTADQATGLMPQAKEDAQMLADLQTALRQEADNANLESELERQMARTSDVALAQMRQQTPEIQRNLKQATTPSGAPQQQAQSLQKAAQAQKQTAETLQKLAQNLQRMENGQMLTEEALAEQQDAEKAMEIDTPLDESYNEAQNLAELLEAAQGDPKKALEALEQLLTTNPQMKRALGTLAAQTAQASQQQLARAQSQPFLTQPAAEQSAHDLSRVARHQQRLGHLDAARQIQAASQAIQTIAQKSKADPSQNTMQSAQQATESAASARQTAAQSASGDASSAPPPTSLLEAGKGALLAQALDQLDQVVNPRQGPQQPGQQQAGQQGQPQPQGQPPQPPSGSPEAAQQSAEQNLAQASQAQAQSMAQARAQGMVPGQQQAGSPQNAQESGKTGEGPGQASQTDSGKLSTTATNLNVPGLTVEKGGDWGHLPSRMASDLTEASRQEPSPEYRAAIESYYKAIAEKARK